MQRMTRAPEQSAWHGTTILALRKGGEVVVAGDGQVSMGQTIVKSNAKKVRRLGGGGVIAGFAGTTADAITLFERLEGKLQQYSGQLTATSSVRTMRNAPLPSPCATAGGGSNCRPTSAKRCCRKTS